MEKDLIISNDYEATVILCRKKILESSLAYLLECNDRCDEIHIKILLKFNKRICSTVGLLIKEIYEHMESSNIDSKQAEGYVEMIQGSCFLMLTSIVEIIQGFDSEEEADVLYDTFAWTENELEMKRYIKRNLEYVRANEMLDKCLTQDMPETDCINEYEKLLSE